MKRLHLLLILFLSIQIGHAQINVKVDERYELTSIAFALAGVPEYCQCRIASYWQDMDKLTPYESTEPINYMRELNQVHGIGYNAISTAADLLEIKNGKIRLHPKYNTTPISRFDSRWNDELFSKYIKMLNIFYKESNFHQFFLNHQKLYHIAEQRMNTLLANTVMDWFKSFFGKPYEADIKIYISLTNGPNNYATPNGVLIGILEDEEGLPAPNSETLNILIHEIGHHYTNTILNSYWREMENAANKIYPKVQDKMAKIAYGDARSTICEWLNNLFVLMYLKDTNNEFFKAEIYHNINKGFIWMQRSVEFMSNFYSNRTSYPYIDSFMPQLVAFLNFTAENINMVEREYQFSQPYITNIYPAPGADITDTNIIIITFSEPMLGSTGFDIISEKEVEILPISECKWIDETHIQLKIEPNMIKRGHIYGIGLKTDWFISAKYFMLDDISKSLIFNNK